jgi:hypothetical protein
VNSPNEIWDTSLWKAVLAVGNKKLWFTTGDLELTKLTTSEIRKVTVELIAKGFLEKGGTDSHRRSLFRLKRTAQLRAVIKSKVYPPDYGTPCYAAPHLGTDKREYIWKPVLRPGALDAFSIPSRGID